ncbi:PAS domain-containing protein [Fluviispira vulneris]|uniref:PAS domain-containing protein n=1 Tax=Fluviispira vulneris TaxID=2763012 RepID=UPI001648E70E|nr:PAS domain-containing protein [Fluviispira vulneris]
MEKETYIHFKKILDQFNLPNWFHPNSSLLSIWNSFGEIIFITKNCVSFYGYTADEIMRKQGFEFFPPDDFESHLNRFISVFNNIGVEYSFKKRILSKKGAYIYTESIAKTIYSDYFDEVLLFLISRKI